MSSFAEQCGLHDAARHNALAHTVRQIETSGVDLVRFAWCDLHGMLRGKTLVASAAAQAMRSGVGMVSTLMLKDTSDRTAFKVFEPGGTADLPGFECASNLLLLGDPTSFKQLPWAPKTGWIQGQLWFQDGRAVELDTRYVLQSALKRLADAGFGLTCGLEIELHVYRIDARLPNAVPDDLDPEQAAWPGLPPKVSLIHPGYNLLSENWADMADEPLRIIQHTAQALGLPLLSLEIELGPSQVEAVFEATDAMTAADNMVLFRSSVKQALRRAGYHATFMCRPPFPNIMSSGWHLHQSLVALDAAPFSLENSSDKTKSSNLFMRDTPAAGTSPLDAQHTLSALGEHYLAGLLAHARAMAVFCTPTVNGYGRFQPNALAPQSVLWGRDNRGAMLRVVGQSGDTATRIENRIGEPAANPYLYIASQIYAGLDGIERQLKAPPATNSPYGTEGDKLPTSLSEALEALLADQTLVDAFGNDFVNYLVRIKRAEWARYEQASDKMEFQRREYFSRM